MLKELKNEFLAAGYRLQTTEQDFLEKTKDVFQSTAHSQQLRNPQSKIANPRSASGFTLIEVLIAITIGSLIILVSAIALRMGLSHLDNGEEWLNKTVRAATAFDFFWQQVSSIRSIEIPKPAYLLERFDEDKEEKDSDKTEIKNIYFKGDIDSMSFISPLSLTRHYGYGLIVATYWQRGGYDGIDLVYKEKRLNPNALLAISNNLFDIEKEKDEVVIFEGCDDITFEYLKTGGDSILFDSEASININSGNINSGESYQEWVGTIENRLPKAIRIVIRKGEEEKELIAPIMVMYSL